MSALILVFLCLMRPLFSATDMERLRLCLVELGRSDEAVRSQLHPEIFSADRKLYHMSLGIPYLLDNERELGGHYYLWDGHLTANAVEGCELYKRQFQARSFKFRLFLASLLTLCAALTLKAIFIIVPLPKGIDETKSDNPLPVSERKRASR